MRAAKVLAVLAIAGLALGAFSAVALAGKSWKATVKVDFPFCDPKVMTVPGLEMTQTCGTHGQNPTLDKSGLVIAQVMLFQRDGAHISCWESRKLRLQLLNRNGKVLTTLDRSTTPPEYRKSALISTLSGQLPKTLPAGTTYVRVKMTKRTVQGRGICVGGFSPTVNPSNGEIVAPASIK